MSTASNLTTLNVAVTLLLNLASAAGKVSAVIAAARAEGREHLTQDELATVRAADDVARADLQAAIAASKQIINESGDVA